MFTTIFAVFLIFHGLVHAILTFVPNPKNPDPVFATYFSGFDSWLFPGISPAKSQNIASSLTLIAAIGFISTGLALNSVLPFNWWRLLAVVSSIVSLCLLIMFWDISMIAGILIDLMALVFALFTKIPSFM